MTMHFNDRTRCEWRFRKVKARVAGLPFLIGFLWVCGNTVAAPVAPGLYARFDTSQGVFWSSLDFTRAPRTVANFVSLAEGAREWIDFSNPTVARRKFYDGLTFHRVVKGFVIQGGSPNGKGDDGPGYRFKDEFHSELRHGKAGMLSMANSGRHSNGSQFFVTLAATPWLDDVHSVFGEVVEGLEVVQAIGSTPVGFGERPNDTVYMNEITIQRIGAEAEGFDFREVLPPLPQVGTVAGSLGFSGNDLLLSYSVNVNRIHYAFFTADFSNWQFVAFDPRLGNISPLRATGIFTSNPRQFFVILNGGFE